MSTMPVGPHGSYAPPSLQMIEVSVDRQAMLDRDALLEEAIELFWEKGFEPESAIDLVAALQVDGAAFLRLFVSGQELCAEARQRYRTKRLDKLIHALDTDCPISGVDAMLDEWAVLMSDPRRQKWFLHNSAVRGDLSDLSIAAEISTFWHRLEDEVTRMLVVARDAGNLSPEKDPRAAARFILAVMRGMSVAGAVATDPEIIRDVASTAITATLQGAPVTSR